ncbi:MULTISPECIES: DUF4136 domain-containing protein [unclassified Imperialibacter]|uniref:DUF4136 domain-containing protein n=1 Tax=unclassified Imperialibacter TaxID=2629706 RepID=UPI00125653D9|nr:MULTISPECIES: DUF4136 domain-containing protein [unclassified Imperialibacter]CAD5265341.1 conserved hypothetical protein [Imperialibacter sp. 89]CAD5270203.1 conserved hypothetical protein [Imperialibacter sp. 75]VVT09831.1 conserved hypothetical protein [Imperialibacter sp. EC-SDR9]
MNSLIKILMAIDLVIILAGCETYRTIYSNYDRSIDFTSYKTFAWAPDSIAGQESENTPYDNDIVRNNVKNYITHGMTQRGFLVDVESPDLVLDLVLLNEKKERIVTYHSYPYSGYYFYNPYYFPYYYPDRRFYTWHGWYGWGYRPPYWGDQVTTYTHNYVRGTITLNMYDRQLKKLVWTGSAEGDIYDPAYIQYNVHPAIDRILKEFPVKPVHKQRGHDDLYKGVVHRNGIDRRIYGSSNY